MRIQLNFRNATITQTMPPITPGCEFKFEFDLSKMNKPRLSSDARMYIETVNLPEFLDEVIGKNAGEIRGYFELLCDNIDTGSSFDTDDYAGGTIIYSSPLVSFHSFVNNDPMYISNFKINQGFLQQKFVLRMRIYDHFGNPFVYGKNLIDAVDVESAEYKDYQAQIKDFMELEDERDDVKPIVDDIGEQLDKKNIAFAAQERHFNNALFACFQAFEEWEKMRGNKSLRDRLRVDHMKIILNNYDTDRFAYFFEEFLSKDSVLNKLYTEEPYTRFQKVLDNLRQQWLAYEFEEKEKNKLLLLHNEINSGADKVWYETEANFASQAIQLRSDKQTVDYTSSSKTGTMDIDFFNSRSEQKLVIAVNNITPTDSSTTHELATGDVLTIDGTNFEHILPDTFDYYFAKTNNENVLGLSFPGRTDAEIKNLRLIIEVNRKSGVYDYRIIKSKGFIAGTQITIGGEYLGGVTTTNDLDITVDSLYVPPSEETYNIEYKAPNKGQIDLEVVKTNATGIYDVDFTDATKFDFTNSSNYVLGEEITIFGDRLGGTKGKHDMKLEVSDVIPAFKEFILNQDSITHIMKPITITEATPVINITDNAGNEIDATVRHPAGWEFQVLSTDGQYLAQFEPSKDKSSGFVDGDLITINGVSLGGKDGINDLTLVVTADAAGKITAIAVDDSKNYFARYPELFSFKVKINTNSPDYVVEYVDGSGSDGEQNKSKTWDKDILVIDGDKLGGVAGVAGNDLQLVVQTFQPDQYGNNVPDVLLPSGVANHESGNIGQVKELTIKQNQGTIIEEEGAFLKTDTTQSGTAAEADDFGSPDLNVTLVENFVRGLGLIRTELVNKQADLDAAKEVLGNFKSSYQTTFGPAQKQKMRTMNMSMVLYDEVPEYTQASQDAIKGNTYSRVQNCQFKRI